MFSTSGDPIDLMRWTETLDRFEKRCDAIEHVAIVVESVVMNNICQHHSNKENGMETARFCYGASSVDVPQKKPHICMRPSPLFDFFPAGTALCL